MMSSGRRRRRDSRGHAQPSFKCNSWKGVTIDQVWSRQTLDAPLPLLAPSPSPPSSHFLPAVLPAFLTRALSHSLAPLILHALHCLLCSRAPNCAHSFARTPHSLTHSLPSSWESGLCLRIEHVDFICRFNPHHSATTTTSTRYSECEVVTVFLKPSVIRRNFSRLRR